jgi:hypothetical protein
MGLTSAAATAAMSDRRFPADTKSLELSDRSSEALDITDHVTSYVTPAYPIPKAHSKQSPNSKATQNFRYGNQLPAAD